MYRKSIQKSWSTKFTDQLPRAIPSHPSSTTGEDRQQHAPQAQTSHKVVVPLPLAAADISSSSTIPPPPSSSSAAAREPEMPMMTVTGRPVQMELPVLGISGSSATDDVPVIYDAFSHHHQQQPFEGPQQPTADFLIPTANNARMLRRFRRRGRRFVSSSNGGGQQQIPEADGSVYCEK